MRIIVDIGHPAHVHYIKNLLKIMKRRGHDFLVTARDKECTHELLQHYNIDFISRKKGSKSFTGKFFYLIRTDYFLWQKAKKFKPDMFISFSSPYAAHASALARKPHIVHDDTEHNRLIHLMYRPFTEVFITPQCYEQQTGNKQIRIPAYLELFHLHPEYFNPDPKIYKELNIGQGEPYAILRFVSRGASHDYGTKGMDAKLKKRAVERISRFCRVFVSSELPLDTEMEQYKLQISPWRIHHALYYANLLFGESATMASEAAVLGTPAIYINKHGRGYTREEEKKYQLVYNYDETLNQQNEAIGKAVEIVKEQGYKNKLKKMRQKLLENSVDPTRFAVWFIENYPESFETMKENPGYHKKFKWHVNDKNLQ